MFIKNGLNMLSPTPETLSGWIAVRVTEKQLDLVKFRQTMTMMCAAGWTMMMMMLKQNKS